MRIWHRNALFVVITLSLFVLMAGPIQALIALALDFGNKHASHILLVPFISGGLIYLNRKDAFKRVRAAVVPGAIVAILGIAILLIGATLPASEAENDRLTLQILSVVVLWLGGFLFCFGTSAFRSALFPLLFLLFAVPMPSTMLDKLIATLQHGSADMAYGLLKLSGTPVYRQGVALTLPGLVVEVAPACSGIRSGISLFIVSVLAGHLLLTSFWKQCVLILVAIPVLIFKNAVRIATLSLLAVHVDKGILASRLHQEGGVLFLMLGLLLLYPVLAILVKSERRERNGDNRNLLSALPLPQEAKAGASRRP